ncbi:hypothetical protein [Pseudaminobacter sp. NGMCC 1.201702]|uniref:hypothetical protein n=1 Tax=Pseudaminobacter sp. NGMCC 1.201702 TaxID=3391825 RepID=UPI0039EFA771
MRRFLTGAVSLLAALALGACTSTQDVLEPSAIAATEQPSSPAPSTGTSPIAASNARIQFAPIVGATVEAATPLTERLASRAGQRGMRLAGTTDPSTTHVLKGYFSALTEGPETTVVYVWDVYDPAGSRLHRINGQQKVQTQGKDGWDSVSPAVMQTIADTTIDQLAAWLAGRTG